MTAVTGASFGAGSAFPGPDVAGAVAARLTELAAQLAGAAPDAAARAAIQQLLGGTFPYPMSDPRYRANALNPGGLPVEVSFAEAEPCALRVDLAPGPPDLGPRARAAAAAGLAGLGPGELVPWQQLLAPRRFGGFAALAIAPGGPGRWSVRHKAYLELGSQSGASLSGMGLPAPQPRIWESAMSAIPGLRPHFVALSPGAVLPGQLSPGPRMYFECTSGLALTTLVAWAREVDLVGPALAAAATVRMLTGGAVVLPAAGLLLALGSTPAGGAELKVECPAAVLGPDPRSAISSILMARPKVEAAFTRWRVALGGSPAPTVVSVRIAAGQAAPTLNVYAGLPS